MNQNAGIITGLLFGLAIGIAFAWALEIHHDRKERELVSELNAARVMAEWEKFEDERP